MAEGGINRVNEAYFLINSKMIFFWVNQKV